MPNPITRRFFLELAVTGGALLLAPHVTRADAPAFVWIAVGPADAVKAGAFTKVEKDGDRAFITRAADGKTFLALYARCTHAGCLINYRTDETRFACPCHGGRFDGTGKPVAGPPLEPLVTLGTMVDDHGILSVHMPAKPLQVD